MEGESDAKGGGKDGWQSKQGPQPECLSPRFLRALETTEGVERGMGDTQQTMIRK